MSAERIIEGEIDGLWTTTVTVGPTANKKVAIAMGLTQMPQEVGSRGFAVLVRRADGLRSYHSFLTMEMPNLDELTIGTLNQLVKDGSYLGETPTRPKWPFSKGIRRARNEVRRLILDTARGPRNPLGASLRRILTPVNPTR